MTSVLTNEHCVWTNPNAVTALPQALLCCLCLVKSIKCTHKSCRREMAGKCPRCFCRTLGNWANPSWLNIANEDWKASEAVACGSSPHCGLSSENSPALSLAHLILPPNYMCCLRHCRWHSGSDCSSSDPAEVQILALLTTWPCGIMFALAILAAKWKWGRNSST